MTETKTVVKAPKRHASVSALEAKTLRAVKKVLLAEPRKADMREWKVTDATDILSYYRSNDPDLVPPCGTIGCINGWVRELNGGRGLYQITDITRSYTPLFYVESWPADLRGRLEAETPGTPSYTAVIAERIDRWIATGA